MLRYLRRALESGLILRGLILPGLILAIGLTLSLAAAALFASKENSMLAALYKKVFGSPDLGPVDFETLKRRFAPNDALACPPGLCNARADFDPGVYPGSNEELRRRFAAAALAEPRVVLVHRSDEQDRPMQDRYIQRSRLMSFPDTIDVRFVALSADTSTLAVYSRSQIGSGDLGVNLARIRRWTQVAMAVAKEP